MYVVSQVSFPSIKIKVIPTLPVMSRAFRRCFFPGRLRKLNKRLVKKFLVLGWLLTPMLSLSGVGWGLIESLLDGLKWDFFLIFD